MLKRLAISQTQQFSNTFFYDILIINRQNKWAINVTYLGKANKRRGDNGQANLTSTTTSNLMCRLKVDTFTYVVYMHL